MRLSRRDVLTRLSVGAACSATIPSRASARLLAVGSPAGSILRLDRNENPYGPSPSVLRAIEDNENLINRYPSDAVGALHREIAKVHRLQPDQVVLGCGAGEILRACVTEFAGAGGKVAVAAPGYDLMRSFAKRAGAEVTAIPLRRDHSHDLAATLAGIDRATGLVYICNPNNPTGTITPRRDIEAFLRALPPHVFVVVDEAYDGFVGAASDYGSFLDDPVRDPRVVVVRTFSTIYGLAGLRVGYAATTPAATARRLASRVEEDLTALSATGARAALQDAEYVRTIAARTANDRQEFFNQANARMLRVIDSVASFVMLEAGGAAQQVVEHFARHGIAVAGPVPAAERYIRVSLGTPADMDRFWRTWDLMPMTGMSM
jgi:histidinol-phosphate aminotransferase